MYEEIKSDYTNLLNQRFNNNREILIESFIEYYGEEYRNRITSIYDDTIMVYFVGENITSLINTYNVLNFELTLQEKKMLEMEKELAENKALTEDEKCKLRYVGSNETNTFSDNDLSKITDAVNKKTPNTHKKLLWTFEGKTNRFIFVPIYIWADSSIIHEMNHNITSDELLMVETENGTSHISKSGLNIDGYDSSDEERIIEELINERSTIDILDIFHKKGGTYVEDIEKTKAHTSESDYRNNFYLIDNFYQNFKEEIKTARISGNKNFLLHTCGKENYYNLVELTKEYYNTGYTIEKEEKISKIIESMINYRNNIEDNSFKK